MRSVIISQFHNWIISILCNMFFTPPDIVVNTAPEPHDEVDTALQQHDVIIDTEAQPHDEVDEPFVGMKFQDFDSLESYISQ